MNQFIRDIDNLRDKCLGLIKVLDNTSNRIAEIINSKPIQPEPDLISDDKKEIINPKPIQPEPNPISDHKKKYIEYLKSPKWKQKRAEALKRANYHCQLCDAKATEVHHRTYKRVFNERISDLTALCSKCHEQFHTDLDVE